MGYEIHTNTRVMSYNNTGTSTSNNGGGVMTVTLENWKTVQCDLLIGADRIWSRVRYQLCRLPLDEVGIRYATKHASCSGYTFFTGTCQHLPKEIDTVAYKFFLGQEQYLGCSDAGHGWQHWWAFLPDAPGRPPSTNGTSTLEHLTKDFQGWSPEIQCLFHATF